jgi:hypothetical protein
VRYWSHLKFKAASNQGRFQKKAARQPVFNALKIQQTKICLQMMMLIFLLFGYMACFYLLQALYVSPSRSRFSCLCLSTLPVKLSLSLFLSVCLFLSLIFSPFLTLALLYQTHTIAHQYRFYFKTRYVYCITRETKAPARCCPKYNYSPSIRIHI